MHVRRNLSLFVCFAVVALFLGGVPAQAAPGSGGSVPEATVATPTLEPTTEDLGLALPNSRARTAAPVVVTAVQELDAPVGAVGVTLTQARAGAAVYVRETTGGSTQPWAELDLEAGATGDSWGTEAYIVAGADSVQIAVVSAAPVAARASVVTSAVSAADATSSDLAWSDPQIRSRAAWGADESLVKNPYTYAQVTGAMIHHTAGTNTYTAEQVPAILRSIQAYHVNGRGWNDIAYNVLVDRFGRAWEGRGGGVQAAVQGGHAWGVTNARVFGISLMGNYETAQPSDAMLDTAERVIAWKFRVHGVDPNGSTYGSGGQDGGSTFLNAISGHRDENATDCPGRYVYARFGEIRSQVAWYLANVYTGAAPSVVGAIRNAWLAQGGESGWLGKPRSNEQCGLAGGGCVQTFAGGVIAWTAGTGAHWVRNAIQATWAGVGQEAGRYGYPLTDEICGLVGGGCYQDFQGGAVYWSGPTGARGVTGAIRNTWAALGRETGLGYPLGNETCGLAGGGCSQGFERGAVYWSSSSGTHGVTGAIRATWGNAGAEAGGLGYPVTDEVCGLASGGCAQHFQGGSIYWSPATGTHWVVGAIRQRWSMLGWENGIGYPVANEVCGLTRGGCYQGFERGGVYWSSATDAHVVTGAIRGFYAGLGYEGGSLGYPASEETPMAGGVYQDFEGGRVFWTPERGVHR